MNKKYNEIKYLIDKYIGLSEDLCCINVCTYFCMHIEKFYLLCMQPDCSLYLLNGISLHSKPNILKINSCEIKTLKIKTDYFSYILFCFFIFPIILIILYRLNYIYPYSYLIAGVVCFILFITLCTLVPSKTLKIETHYAKKYRLHYTTFTFLSSQFKETQKLKQYVKHFPKKE